MCTRSGRGLRYNICDRKADSVTTHVAKAVCLRDSRTFDESVCRQYGSLIPTFLGFWLFWGINSLIIVQHSPSTTWKTVSCPQACKYNTIAVIYGILMNSMLSPYTPVCSGAINLKLKDSNPLDKYGSPPIHPEKYPMLKKDQGLKNSGWLLNVFPPYTFPTNTKIQHRRRKIAMCL